MKKKVIYILSLEHSGSTVLDILLSSHPRIVSLGEIHFVLENKKTSIENTKDICSCLNKMNDCHFWGGYLNKYLKNNLDKSFAEKYKALLKYVNQSLGEDIIISDSSKKLSVLKQLLESDLRNEIDLRIIFLIKDVRSWAISKKRVFLKQKRKGNFYLRHILSWYKANRKIKDYLEAKNLKYLQIGYEELCLKQDYINDLICDSLDIKKEKLEFAKNGKHHIAYGNRMKLKREQKLRYDYRWFSNWKVNFLTVLLPFVFFWNKKNTYSN